MPLRAVRRNPTLPNQGEPFVIKNTAREPATLLRAIRYQNTAREPLQWLLLFVNDAASPSRSHQWEEWICTKQTAGTFRTKYKTCWQRREEVWPLPTTRVPEDLSELFSFVSSILAWTEYVCQRVRENEQRYDALLYLLCWIVYLQKVRFKEASQAANILNNNKLWNPTPDIRTLGEA
jgi:hypothetical protein